MHYQSFLFYTLDPFNKIGLDQGRTHAIFVCIEAAESKLLKLETSHTVIPPQRWVFSGDAFPYEGIGYFICFKAH